MSKKNRYRNLNNGTVTRLSRIDSPTTLSFSLVDNLKGVSKSSNTIADNKGIKMPKGNIKIPINWPNKMKKAKFSTIATIVPTIIYTFNLLIKKLYIIKHYWKN